MAISLSDGNVNTGALIRTKTELATAVSAGDAGGRWEMYQLSRHLRNCYHVGRAADGVITYNQEFPAWLLTGQAGGPGLEWVLAAWESVDQSGLDSHNSYSHTGVTWQCEGLPCWSHVHNLYGEKIDTCRRGRYLSYTICKWCYYTYRIC